MICRMWRPWEIRFDAELFGAPVAQVLEYRDQGLPGGAERISDLRRRRGNCPSFDEPIPCQFAELRSENFFTDAAQEIAELGEAQRDKRKTPHCLDFPLTAQDIDGRLNGTAMMNLHGALRAYNLCVLHRCKLSLYHGPEGFGSRETARILHFLASRTRREQENDSYYWQQRKRWKNGFARSNSEGVQGPWYVPFKRGGGEGALGMRGGAGGLCGQAEFAEGARRSEFCVRSVLPDSATRGTREQYSGCVQRSRGEARGAEFSAGGGRLSQIVSGLASQGGRQAQRDRGELHNPPAEWVSAKYRCLQCSEHPDAGGVLRVDGRCEGQLSAH